MKTLTPFVLFVMLLPAILFPDRVVAQDVAVSNCLESRTAPAMAPYRWSPSSKIKILFAPNHFKTRERRALRQALNAWQELLSPVGIDITFLKEEERLPNPGEDRYLFIQRSETLPAGREGQFTSLRGSDGYFTAGEIAIKKGRGNSSKLNIILQHELGHAFGLMDCPSCKSGTTVMNLSNPSVKLLWLGIQMSKQSTPLARCDQETLVKGYRTDPTAGTDIPVNTVIGEDVTTESLISKKDFDTSAPEVGEGKTLTDDNGDTSNEPSPEERSLTDALLIGETKNARLLANYAFKRDVIIETLATNGKVTGSYHRLSQMVFDDAGERIERILSFPKPTLKHLIITDEDLRDLAGVQLLGLEIAKADLYRVIPAGRDDRERTLLFRVVPNDLAQAKLNGQRVFHGMLWVDERTMRIVRIKGKALPEGNQRFPTFETRRDPVADEIYGPVSTYADDILNFPGKQIRMRIQVRYFDYQRFRSEVKITEVVD